MLFQDTKNSRNKPCNILVVVITEQVSALNRRQGPASADVPVGDITVVESDRDKPWLVWGAQSQLLDSQNELLILIANFTCVTRTREARYKNERISGNRVSNLSAPVLARPQVGRVSPYPDARQVKCTLQTVDFTRILADVGNEDMPSQYIPSHHPTSLWNARALR